jgi:hypothetical protein
MQRKVPRMTRGHYQFIADTLNKYSAKPSEQLFLAELFAGDLAQTNPRFKRDMFIARATKPHKTVQDYVDEITDKNVADLRAMSKKLKEKLVA